MASILPPVRLFYPPSSHAITANMLAFAVLLVATAASASPALLTSYQKLAQTPVYQRQFVAHQRSTVVPTLDLSPAQLMARHGGFKSHHTTAPKTVSTVQQNLAPVLEQQVNHVSDVSARHHNTASGGTAATAQILRQQMEVRPDGSFNNMWASENGISVQEQGVLKTVGDTKVAVSNGDISYVDDEGHQYHLTYVADENGFRPEGDHLPTSPPLPVAIARSLEYIAAHPYVESTTYSSLMHQ